jgi:rhodanese-related sulfurtransferase
MTDASPDQPASQAHQIVPTISRAELVAALRSDHPPALFEVLPTGYWKKHHLPGAISAPPEQAAAIITAQVPDHDADIVVYCWDPG